jgi:hypothetical protein
VKIFKSLAIILGLEEGDVRTSLHSQSILAKSGLLKLESHGGTLGMRLELLSEDFADSIPVVQAPLVQAEAAEVPAAAANVIPLPFDPWLSS